MPEQPSAPAEGEERELEALETRLRSLNAAGRGCRQWHFAAIGLSCAVFWLRQARLIGRTPIRPGEFDPPPLDQPSPP